MRYEEVVRSFLESQSNKEKNTNPHSQLHILSHPEVIPNDSGRKENWYIRFITLCMSNFNIPGEILDENTVVLAWDPVPKKRIKNEQKWISSHVKEIKEQFNIEKVEYKDFCLAESLMECICEYLGFFHYDLIRCINGIYVIKIL